MDNIPPRILIPHGDSFKPPPTRRGKNGERRRVTQACDQCRTAKQKCSGNTPCVNCITGQRPCSYDLPYTRGRRVQIQLNPAVEQNLRYSSFNDGLISVNPGSSQQEQREIPPMIGPYGRVVITAQMMAPYQEQFNKSSNATFFHGTQQRLDMPRKDSHVPVFAFGDLPMVVGRAGMVALPNKEVGAILVATYFEKVSPSLLFLHRPSVESWTMDVLSDDGYILHKNELKSRNAAVFLIFASAQAYNAVPEPTDTSMHHFHLADEQLQSETGPPQLVSIQARLLQCYYLLAKGRINQCWSTFGTVVSLIFALGIQRKHSHKDVVSLIDIECQKRVFWAAFILDKYLSYALHRPQLIELGNTDQDVPKLIKEKQSTPSILIPASQDTLSKNFASNLQIELAIIISKILKNIYGIRKPDIKRHLELARAYKNDKLKAWKNKAALLIDADPHTLSEIYKRQRTELLLAYNHAHLLLLRDFILDAATNDEDLMDEIDGMISDLVDACKNICQIIEPLSEYWTRSGSIQETQPHGLVPSFPFRSAWFTQYVIYSAAVVTYIMSQQDPESSTKSSSMVLKKSRLLHEALRTIAQPGTFIAECVSVLDELKYATIAAIEHHLSMKYKAKIAQNGENGKGGEDEDMGVDVNVRNDGRSVCLGGGPNGYEREDTEMSMGMGMNMDMRRDGGDGYDGRIPIMKRIKDWGFSRLTGYHIRD
ncbi:4b352ceb-2a94-493f-95f8-685ee4d53755 [Sclerotinia trifoliorum]|uniref:4b352ceb-2a94-493f-95f8-685ee4d53755 n=1 Tax=Sclerotinia trifoliorum TaxID=28548 RepID=A0A8H2ZRC5_9HELO|nr:4b352ceb-2a94-493f-95f8-685ee4d53755 [Sclerotinia trifoliorum]